MKITSIVFDEETRSLKFLSPDGDSSSQMIGEIALTGVVADDLDDLSLRLGRLVFGLLEHAIGYSPFRDYSFGKELDEPKLRRIEQLKQVAQGGNPDGFFEIFNIYFAVGVRSLDEEAFSLAETYLNRAVDAGSKKAIEYTKNEWPQVRDMSLAHIRRHKG